jgi:hypothetical protein
MAENGGILPTTHYTVGPKENSIKNIGGNGPDRAPTAQNTHTLSGWSETAGSQQMAEGEPSESGDLCAGVNG